MKLETLERWVRKDRKALRRLAWRVEDFDVLLDFLWILFFVPLAERVRRLEKPPSERKPLPPGGTLDEIIYNAILAAIERTGSKSGAAKELRVDEATIRNRLRKWEKMGMDQALAPKGKPGRPPNP